MKPGALLYTNTSGIDIDIMADATKRPQDVAGTHFFAPANVTKLFEAVKGTKSAPDTLATGMALGRKIGKISAMAGNGDGFVANRSRTPFGTEMNIMVEEGALPEQVDKVMVDFGYPIGPFATADLSGLDIGYDSRQRRAAENPNYRKMPIADMIVEAGRLGQKTRAGWFRTRRATAPCIPTPSSPA
jgi:3-hydroxyacyl-CoA dehydrogenase